MMDLFTLPNFHHEIFYGVAVFVLVLAIWMLKRRKKDERVRLRTREELYDFSKRLQQFGKDREIEDLLAKLRPYKYAPKTSKIPKNLRKEALALYEKKRKTKMRRFFDLYQ